MRSKSIVIAAAVSAILVTAVVSCGSGSEDDAAPLPQASSPTVTGSTSSAPTTVPTENRRTGDELPAPELIGTGAWINSQPFTLASRRGEVVLVDFWTFSCINCKRTLPYLKSWHEKYADSGLVILGVHAPEFNFEKDIENVQEAVEEHGLLYPIVQDNQFSTWRAFKNRYWPTKYLIDKDGYIRFVHIGEGRYEETEQWIRDLLEEPGTT